MINVMSFSKDALQLIKKLAGFIDRLGWIIPDGSFWGIKRGELHAHAALRYIKQVETSKGKTPQEISAILMPFKKLIKSEEWNKTYEFMASNYGLIRVSDDQFDMPSFDASVLSRLSNFIRSQGYGMNSRVNISNVFTKELFDITIETLEEEDYNIPRALQTERLFQRSIGAR